MPEQFEMKLGRESSSVRKPGELPSKYSAPILLQRLLEAERCISAIVESYDESHYFMDDASLVDAVHKVAAVEDAVIALHNLIQSDY